MCIRDRLGTSQIIRWQGDKATLDIGAQVTILEDPGGTLSIDDVSSDAYLAAFKPSGSPNLILGYTLSVFWVKFSLDNPSGNPLMLEISQAGLPDCDLYFKLDGSGTFNSYRAGSNTPFHQRHIKSSFQVFPLQSGTHDYYIRLTTNSGPIPLKIYDQNKMCIRDRYTGNSYALYGFKGRIIFIHIQIGHQIYFVF